MYSKKKYSRRSKKDTSYHTLVSPYNTTLGGLTQRVGTYAKCVLDPEHSSSCVIPDLNTYPTSTYSSQTTFQLPIPTAAGFTTGFVWNIKSDPNTGIAAENVATSTDATYAYSAVAPMAGAAAITATYKSARVVGASVRLEFCGPDTADQGIIFITSLGNNLVEGGTSILANSVQANARNTYVGPLKNGAIATYRPIDASNFDMQNFSASYVYGQIVCHISGIALSTTGVQLLAHVTIHYEGVTTVQSDIARTTIHTNANELSATQSSITGVNTCSSGSEIDQRSRTSQADKIGESLFQQVMSGVGGVAGFALGGSYGLYSTSKGKKPQGPKSRVKGVDSKFVMRLVDFINKGKNARSLQAKNYRQYGEI